MKQRKLFVKEDVLLPVLQEYGFKLVETEKKNCYQCNGIEVDTNTREVKSSNKSDLILLLDLYNNNLLDIRIIV